MPNSPSKQHKPFDPGLTRSTSMDHTDKGSKLTPVPLRQSSRMMRNQPPWRYQNFALWHNDIFPGTFNIWVGLCICLHIISCMHIVFMGNTVLEHSIWATAYLPNTNDSWHWRGYNPCWLYGGFWMGGPQLHHCRNWKRTTPDRDPVGIWAVWPWRQCTW